MLPLSPVALISRIRVRPFYGTGGAAMSVDEEPAPGPQDDAEALHVPRWEVPDRYGEAEALNSMGTIASPLLAGFSLAAMVQTVTITSSEARWPDAALMLFFLAAVLFIAAVQAMFWARGYQASPAEITGWWPDAENPDRLKLLRREQKRHVAGFRMWANRARRTYNAGLLSLLAALVTVAVPPESQGHTAVLRWLAVSVGGVAFVVEIMWITASITGTKWAARLLTPQLPDDASSADGEQ
jgi:hypothetical protein